MSNKESTAWVSRLLIGLLTLIFITLKLCNIIAWSWWWVLSPLWIVSALAALVFLVSIVYLLLTQKKREEEQESDERVRVESKWAKKLREIQDIKNKRTNP